MSIPKLDSKNNLFDILQNAQAEYQNLEIKSSLDALSFSVFFDWAERYWVLLLITLSLILLIRFIIVKSVAHLESHTQNETRVKTWYLLRWHFLKALQSYIAPLIACMTFLPYQMVMQTKILTSNLTLVFFMGVLMLWILIDTLLRRHGILKTVIPLPKLKHRTLQLTIKILLCMVFTYIVSEEIFKLPENLNFPVQSATVIIGSFVTVICILQVTSLANFNRQARRLSILASAVLLTCIIAELSGYTSYARWVYFGTLGTLCCVSLWSLLIQFIRDITQALQTPDHHWHGELKALLHIDAEDTLKNIPWLSFVIQTLMTGLMILGVLSVWGLSIQTISWAQNTFVEGFSIGKSTIVPLKIIIGIITFIIILNVGRSISGRISSGSLLRHKLDSSAIETITKMTTYIGFMVAAVVGLTMAGFNFQNLAIIAGALSVGIGFGLQNIVNNFVSGIILLFERPVRTGDWVSVGNQEGFVKNIRVRSTEVQTWDRTDVIIPNSEFISQQVTNYTLRDPHGRLKISLCVRYGTDTQMVRSLLLEIAEAQHRVIKTGRNGIPKPEVYFMSFDEGRVHLQLWVFIRNIRDKWQATSELNFEIDRRFREAGIEIPIPQHGLHIRSSIPIPFEKDMPMPSQPSQEEKDEGEDEDKPA